MKLDSLVTRTGDAAVSGTIRDIGIEVAGLGFFLGPLMVLFYVGFAIAAIVAGLLLAGIAARHVRAAEALISRRPWHTLAVGIAGIFLPLFVVTLLFVSVVGAPLAIGILLGAWPAVGFLGYLVAGIWIGDQILGRTSGGVARERPYAAAVIGLVVLQVLAVLPIVPFVASLFGYGAVLLLPWRTLRGDPDTRLDVRQASPAPMAS